MPFVLEIQLFVADESDSITNTSGFEIFLKIQGETYELVGAMLNNGSHWRSIARHQNSYLVYDGIKNGRKGFMWWIGENADFTNNMLATRVWYKHISRKSDVPSSLQTSQGTTGYPDKVTVGPVRHMGVSHVTCDKCGNTIDRGNQCLTHRLDEFGVTSLHHFHFPACCPESAQIPRQSVIEAVDASHYDSDWKKRMKEEIESEFLCDWA